MSSSFHTPNIGPSGTATLRPSGKLYHIGIGRTHARTHVLLLIQGTHIRVNGAATGELLHELTLDPARNYQPRGSSVISQEIGMTPNLSIRVRGSFVGGVGVVSQAGARVAVRMSSAGTRAGRRHRDDGQGSAHITPRGDTPLAGRWMLPEQPGGTASCR